MSTVPYWKKLLDPRWQRKRLEILQRDDFMCRCCGCSDETLHVHHRFYKKGVEPWDYEDKAYVTVCSDCHIELAEVEQLVIMQLPPLQLSYFYDLASVLDHANRKGILMKDLISACKTVLNSKEATHEH